MCGCAIGHNGLLCVIIAVIRVVLGATMPSRAVSAVLKVWVFLWRIRGTLQGFVIA